MATATPRLPQLDPAANRTPRRGYIPGAEENPYIPHMRTRVGKAATPRATRMNATAPAVVQQGSQSARSGPTDAELREMQYKRSERIHDSYQTALARETLLSEQYAKELSQVKESLAKLQTRQPLTKSHDVEVAALRTRGKLEKRCAGFESKLNELKTYNQKLMEVINGLRKQNEPIRQARVRLHDTGKKLVGEVAHQKQLCNKSLDERERCVDQLRHLKEDSEADQETFMEVLEQLKQESDALDRENRAAMQTLEKATEEAKRQQWSTMRSHRSHKEKLEVRYGYLRSQLEGVDRDFRELQRIVGVHFVPSQPESLQQIINKYVEKEGKIASLLKYSEQQNDEMRALKLSIADAQASLREVDGGDGADAGPSKRSDAPDADARRKDASERQSERFEGVCKLLESMHRAAKCQGGRDLETKGCSSSTVADFMSGIATRLDELQMVAASMREHATNYRGSRKSNEVFDAFLKPALSVGGEEQPTETVKRILPSMSDQGPDQDGETDAQERARTRDAGKGAIDRQKRDEVIAAWVGRQRTMKGGVSARPSIRSYYEEETKSFFEARKRVYAPASARQ